MAAINPFKKAKRQNRKLRAALDGPSGAGKSYSAMRLAQAMKAAGLCTRIAAIDTESESLSLYEGEAPDGVVWEFDTLNLKQFSPTQFTAAIKEAENQGYDCIVIDSLSHAWIGKDGALDLVDKKDGNKFAAWKDVTPMHREMIDAIIGSKAHIIATMRSKTEYVMEESTNRNGQKISVPRKIGMAPVQRDGMEYEFDLYGSMDWSHQFKVTKSRCSVMQDRTDIKPGPSFWQPLFDWLNGIAVVAPSQDEPKAALEESREETFARLKSEITSVSSEEGLEPIVEKLKNEIGKLDESEKKALRQLFRTKRESFAPAPAAA